MRKQMHPGIGTRMVQRPRTRNTLRQNLIIAGSLLLLNTVFAFCYFYFGKSNNAYASQMRNGGNGNWNSSSTWALSRVPASNDTITIMAGNNVVINANTSVYSNMKIIVYGTLHINGGKKLELSNGMIDVITGGVIEGDNAGSMVNINGLMAWNGSTPGNGPMQVVANPLPVVLASFNAESTTNGTVHLSWQTASEVNCDYFSVERSSDGYSFQEISKVQGSGNTTTSRQYSYIDENPHSPVSYYRLKQVDFDGKFEIFKMVSVNIMPAQEVVIYPNPVATGESATVHIPAGGEKSLQVTVMDMHGKQLFSQTIEKENSADNMIHFVTEKFLSSGTYFVTACGQSNKYMKKIIVL